MAQYQKDYPGWGVSDGNVFCSSLAKQVGCYVVAAAEKQCEVPTTVPLDQMTSFEGLVLSYDPSGRVSWMGRNPSTYNKAGVCVQVPD